MESPTPGPVNRALAELCEWLAGAAGPGTTVRVARPVEGGPDGLYVWPLAFLDDRSTRGGTRQPLRLRVRHQILVGLPAAAAGDVLDRILAAVAATDQYHLVLDPAAVPAVPAGLWPAVVLDVPVRIDVAPAQVPRVSGDLRLVGVAPRRIHGLLLGPGDVPLAGMTVSAPGTHTRVDTDTRGRFVLAAQPADRTVVLHLSGRGRQLRADVPPETANPVVIHCDIEEN